jgi:hypothetical protein
LGGRTALEFTGPESLVHGHPLSGYRGRKLLNYPKYIMNSNPDAYVHVFKQVIKMNGVT